MSRPEPAIAPVPGSRVWWSGMLPTPTYRAAIVLAVAAVISALGPAGIGWVVPVAVVGVLVGVDAFLAPAPWAVAVSRELPAVLPLDGEGTVTWRVRNPTERPLKVWLADGFAPSLGATRRRFALSLAGRGQQRVTTTLHPQRRGTFLPTELTVRVAGPLNLATRQAARSLPGRIEIHPRFRSRSEALLRIRRGRILEQGRRAARGAGTGTEFEALRDYVQGDEYRHVDWAATARVGHPVVRTYRVERDQTVIVLLDHGRLMAGAVDGVPRLDHAMDATLALATVTSALGDRIGLVAYGSRVHRVVAPRRDREQLRRLSTELHALQPELAASDHDAAVRAVLARTRRRALVVLLTDLAPEASEDTLLPVLPSLLRYHRVLVAGVRDPEIGERIDARVHDVADVYRAAGAATIEDARRRVVQGILALGAGVVDAEPRGFAAAVADAYLETKTSGGW